MALATQCPFCQTTFRVAGDQLKLRGGLVRCGHCHEVFDGNAHLLPDQPGSGNWPQQTPLTSPPITPAIARANAAAPNYGQPPPVVLPDADAMVDIEAAWDLPPSIPSLDKHPADATENEDIDAGDALMIERETEEERTTEQGDEPRSSIDDEDDAKAYANIDFNVPPLPPQPSSAPFDDEWQVGKAEDWDAYSDRIEPDTGDLPATYKNEFKYEADEQEQRDGHDNHAEDDDYEQTDVAGNADEPVEQLEFIQAAQRREQRARTKRLFMIVGSVLLVLTGIGQGVYLGRNRLADAIPSLKPALTAACKPLHCAVGLQKQIDQLSIESNELQAATPDQPALMLNLILRNRGDVAQAWPAIELTLNDDDEKALVRRVFTPAEYLPSLQLIDGGIAANAEQSIKLSFTMTQGTASGYRVYLFYP